MTDIDYEYMGGYVILNDMPIIIPKSKCDDLEAFVLEYAILNDLAVFRPFYHAIGGVRHMAFFIASDQHNDGPLREYPDISDGKRRCMTCQQLIHNEYVPSPRCSGDVILRAIEASRRLMFP